MPRTLRARLVLPCALLCAFALRPSPAAAQCDEDHPFLCAVEDAAERGRDHIRRLEAGTGFADGASHRDNALAALVFLEEWRGYGIDAIEALDPRDRALVRRLLTRLLEREAVWAEPDAPLDVVRTGAALLALGSWRYMAGDDDLGAPRTVDAALQVGAEALIAAQTTPPDMPGAWRITPDGPPSMVATLFAVRGLRYGGVIAGSGHSIVAAGSFLVLNRNPDRGQPAVPGGPSRISAPAASRRTAPTAARSAPCAAPRPAAARRSASRCCCW